MKGGHTIIDRDKVVSRLQIIRTWAEVGKNYNGIQGEGCLRDIVDWIDDALVLLKEQEPVEPIKTKKEIDFRSEIVDAFCCGNCRHELDHCEKWRYCPNCGKAVKWDD